MQLETKIEIKSNKWREETQPLHLHYTLVVL